MFLPLGIPPEAITTIENALYQLMSANIITRLLRGDFVDFMRGRYGRRSEPGELELECKIERGG